MSQDCVFRKNNYAYTFQSNSDHKLVSTKTMTNIIIIIIVILSHGKWRDSKITIRKAKKSVLNRNNNNGNNIIIKR